MSQKDANEWLPPPAFDGFVVLGRLGRGGMGHVYRARDATLDRDVALKFIAAVEPSSADRRRLMTEARAIARLQHPNVVGIYRMGDVQGRPYIAYEFVEGRSLDRESLPLPWSRALAIAAGIARGLAASHRRDVLHRDVKPANIMLTATGDVKLLDFGLAKLLDAAPPAEARGSPAPPSVASPARLDRPGRDVDADHRPGAGGDGPRPLLPSDAGGNLTVSGQVLGTPLYLAPEIWLGEGATARSDLYSLGLVLYEMLAGRLPFEGLPRDRLVEAVVAGEKPPIASLCRDAPAAFFELIERCSACHPAERYASAEQVVAALDALTTLYQPFQSSAPVETEEKDAVLVARSFARIASNAERFAARVYQRLFAAHPDIAALFPSDLSDQRKKLLGALQIVVENGSEPARLLPLLEDLGRRHAPYGVVPAHFDALGQAFLGALAEIEGKAFTLEVERAWSRSYATMTEAMQRGLLDERTTPLPISFEKIAYQKELVLDPPRTRYVRSRDINIAYQIAGAGPIDLALVLGWVTHLEVGWRSPELARMLRRLAAFSRIILFDKRGIGLSDAGSGESGIDEQVEDILAVLDAAGSRRAVLLGVSEGAAVAALFAARHAERVRGLVLYGGSPCPRANDDDPDGIAPSSIELAMNEVSARWGGPLFLQRCAPSMARDPAFRRWWASYLRAGAAPGAAAMLLRMIASIDARPALPHVRAPTLVMHRARDAWMPLSGSRRFGAGITGAELVVLEGDDHLPFVGDTDALLGELRRFLVTLTESQSVGREALGNPA